MALRLPVLISISLFLLGCLRASPHAETSQTCGSCHAPHYAEVATCVECHRGQPDAARKELAHARLLFGRAAEHGLRKGTAVREGRQLADTAACRRCHTIDSQGNRLATNLDNVVWRREQPEVMKSITAPVENMPTFGFDRGQAEALIAFLLSVARPNVSEEVHRVLFTRDERKGRSTFEEKCGGCHRLLNSLGPQGSGSRGPNLSGLLTAFYPRTAPGERGWSEELLTRWVANPRALRTAAIMPPVPLTATERQQVLDEIRPSAPSAASR